MTSLWLDDRTRLGPVYHRARGRLPRWLVGVAAVATAACSTSGGSAGSGSANSTALGCPGGGCGTVEFFSSQGQPVNEQAALRRSVLAGFPGTVHLSVPDDPVILSGLQAQEQAGNVKIDALGDLNGSFSRLQQQGYLEDLTGLMSGLEKNRQFDPKAVATGKLGTSKQYYIPWMQGTYFMVANKKAMAYLPSGAKLNDLSYDQLVQWGENMKKATGQPQIGLPAGPKGLIARFLEGYVYPAYTGGEVTTFKSAEAVKAWQMLQKLWSVSAPQSTNYAFMQQPLESGEVMVAWDNNVRLIQALSDQPNEFVAFPAPRGPKGRSYISVLVGLAIPKGAPNRKGSEALIDYLTQAAEEEATVKALSFFPVLTNVTIGSSAGPGLQAEAQAAKAQVSSSTITSILPVGLGTQNAAFDKAYTDAFTRIILKGEEIQSGLNSEATQLQSIMTTSGARCWAPDPPSSGPCQVK